MSDRYRGVLPIVVGVVLQLAAVADWAFQWLWSLPAILDEPIWAWCWQPQMELATALDQWTGSAYGGPVWVVVLMLVLLGPQVAASLGSGVLGLVALARGRGAVRAGGAALAALSLPLLAWAIPSVLGGIAIVLYTSNPRVW